MDTQQQVQHSSNQRITRSYLSNANIKLTTSDDCKEEEQNDYRHLYRDCAGSLPYLANTTHYPQTKSSGLLLVWNEQQVLKRRELFASLPKPYKCRFSSSCNESFESYRMFKKHMKYHKSLECKICQKQLGTPQTLKAHIKTHAKGKSFMCAQTGCKSWFRLASSLKDHESRYHSIIHTQISEDFPNKTTLSDQAIASIHKEMLDTSTMIRRSQDLIDKTTERLIQLRQQLLTVGNMQNSTQRKIEIPLGVEQEEELTSHLNNNVTNSVPKPSSPTSCSPKSVIIGCGSDEEYFHNDSENADLQELISS